MVEEKKELNLIGQLITKEENKSGTRFNFTLYAEKGKVGKAMFKDYCDFYKDGPYIDLKNEQKHGVLTDLMGLATLIEYNFFDVDLNDKFYGKFFELVDKSIKAVTKEETNYEDCELFFTTEPYFESTITTYVETLSKFIITFVDVRDVLITEEDSIKKYYINKNMTEREANNIYFAYLKNVQKLLIRAMDILSNACLKVEEKNIFDFKVENEILKVEDPKVRYRGWSCVNPGEKDAEYGTSIYFTYHATNAYVAFYDSCRSVLDNIYLDKKVIFESDNKDELTTEEKQNIIFVTDDERKKYIKDEIFIAKEEGNKDIITKFRDSVIGTGRYISTKLDKNEVDLSFDYIKNDFSPIRFSQDIFENKNNYLCNTLFTIATLVNCGIDDAYALMDKGEYFNDQVQFALNNVKKAYTMLKKQKRSGFAEYTVNFTERYSNDINVEEMRNSYSNIRVYDFIPLFCNVYCLCTRYLIRYPQKDMRDILELVIENCQKDTCLWSKQGIDLNNNLYYTLALAYFYDYYYKYEQPFIANANKRNKDFANLESEKKKATAVVNDLQVKVEEKTKELEEAKSEVQRSNELLLAVQKVVEQYFKDHFDSQIEAYFNGLLLNEAEFWLAQFENKKSFIGNSFEKFGEEFKKTEFLYQIVAGLRLNGATMSSYARSTDDKPSPDEVREILNKQIRETIKKEVDKF